MSDLVDVSKIYLSNSSGQKGIQLAEAAIIGPYLWDAITNRHHSSDGAATGCCDCFCPTGGWN